MACRVCHRRWRVRRQSLPRQDKLYSARGSVMVEYTNTHTHTHILAAEMGSHGVSCATSTYHPERAAVSRLHGIDAWYYQVACANTNTYLSSTQSFHELVKSGVDKPTCLLLSPVHNTVQDNLAHPCTSFAAPYMRTYALTCRLLQLLHCQRASTHTHTHTHSVTQVRL